MRVVAVPEFNASRARAVKTSQDDKALTGLLDRLSEEHGSAQMRSARLDLDYARIQLWATEPIRLGNATYRVTWRYHEDDDERRIVCFTLAEV